MLTCEQCRESLFDSFYGLLEGGELLILQEHLRGCLSCQAALAQVETQVGLMAKAAKAIPVVPEFKLPSEVSTSIAPGAAPAPLPITTPTKRPLWRRPLLAWVTAAAILVVVGTSISYYNTKLTRYRNQLADARKQRTALDTEFAGLPTKYESLHKKTATELRDHALPYIHVVGPTQLQPNAKAHLYVTTRTPDGAPAESDLRVRLVDAQTGTTVYNKRDKADRNGKKRIELDPGHAKPGAKLDVIVEAESGGVESRVQGNIRVQAPSYVTRIDTNKVLYPVNDVLFFRVLVLDRFSLMPPAQPILVRVSLRNQNGVVAQLEQATGEGGIVAKEFPIASNFPAGQYTLMVEPLDPSQTPVQIASQRIDVVRDLRVPDLVVAPGPYAPGDNVSGFVRGGPAPEKATAKVGNQPPVPVTITPQIEALSAPAKGGMAKIGMAPGNASPQALRYSFPIPKQLPKGASKFLPFTLELQTGAVKKQFEGVVPLEPSDYEVDFYPEGGDLIAGVLNRVYYRVRAKAGEPITSDGSVILWSSKDVIDSNFQLGLGFLDFVPEPKETYTLRITSNAKTTELSQNFAMRKSGVVLHLPSAVDRQGEPIRLTLRNQGPERKLLLVAQCRGQVVDQRWADVKTGSQDFTLEPTREARGIIKVTAYEVGPLVFSRAAKTLAGGLATACEGSESVLTPIAERLAYRTPVQKLDLGVTLSTQQHLPGKNMIFHISSLTERREPASNWLLASVVDERFLSRSRSLSAHFMLLNEIRSGSELEDAQVVLHDSPDSAEMLERFLGTHGWRRFIPTSQPGPVTPLVFSRENLSPDALLKQYDAKFDIAMTPIRVQAFREAEHVRTERVVAAAQVQIATSALNDFEDNVRATLGLAAGIVLVLLLLSSFLCMLIGIVRVVRQTKPATPLFGGAFACLGLCLGMLFLGRTLVPEMMPTRDVPGVAHQHPIALAEQLQKVLGQAPEAKKSGPRTSAPFAAAHALRANQADDFAGKAVKSDAQMMALADRPAGFGGGGLGGRGTQPTYTARLNNNALDQRRREAEATLTEAGKGQKADKGQEPLPLSPKKKSPAVQPQPAPPNVAPVAADKKLVGVEYAHPYAPGLYADTLLWHPALWIVDGAGEVRFDIGSGQTTYRVLLLGHSTTGRFGFFETRLDVLPVENAK